MAQRTKAPFRADHVGSLLRPAALKEARAKRAKGEISAEALRQIEDRAIEQVIRKQEEVGLKLATDGEFRRSWWHFDFYKGLEGVEMFDTRQRHRFCRRRDQGRGDPRCWQGRLLRPPASRAFQVLEGAHQGHTEDDHSGAEHDALPPGPAKHQQAGLPRHGRLLR
jgi:hypothetical protein